MRLFNQIGKLCKKISRIKMVVNLLTSRVNNCFIFQVGLQLKALLQCSLNVYPSLF